MSSQTNFPEAIIIHTAEFEGDVSAETIDEWHKENGWSKIGYHYVVRKNGAIENGRDELKKGAHCLAGGMNDSSIGICVSGHGDKEAFTNEQITSISALCVSIMRRYSIELSEIRGHRYYDSNRSCPGELVDMGELRSNICNFNNSP